MFISIISFSALTLHCSFYFSFLNVLFLFSIFYFLCLLLELYTRQIRGDGIGAFLTSIQADVDATTAAGSTTMTEEKEEDSKMDEE